MVKGGKYPICGYHGYYGSRNIRNKANKQVSTLHSWFRCQRSNLADQMILDQQSWYQLDQVIHVYFQVIFQFPIYCQAFYQLMIYHHQYTIGHWLLYHSTVFRIDSPLKSYSCKWITTWKLSPNIFVRQLTIITNRVAKLPIPDILSVVDWGLLMHVWGCSGLLKSHHEFHLFSPLPPKKLTYPLIRDHFKIQTLNVWYNVLTCCIWIDRSCR